MLRTIIALWVLTGCLDEDPKKHRKPKNYAVPVEVSALKLQQFDDYDTFMGLIKGQFEATLHAYRGGHVKRVFGKAGDKVKVGQKLCNIEANKAAVHYQAMRLNERIALGNLSRTRVHVHTGTASRKKKSMDRLSYLTAKQNRIDAYKGLKGAHCQSPIQGVITQRFIEPLQELSPNAQTFHLAYLDKVKLKAEIPETSFLGYKVGNPAELTVSQFPGAVWRGKIRMIDRKVDHKNKTINMELLFDNTDAKLFPGMTASVRVLRRSFAKALLIPSKVISFQKKQKVVMVVEDQKAKVRNITPGVQVGDQTLILEGLKAGDQLIVKGGELVADGQKVRVRKEKLQ